MIINCLIVFTLYETVRLRTVTVCVRTLLYGIFGTCHKIPDSPWYGLLFNAYYLLYYLHFIKVNVIIILKWADVKCVFLPYLIKANVKQTIFFPAIYRIIKFRVC